MDYIEVLATIVGAVIGLGTIFFLIGQSKAGKNKTLEDANAKLTETLNQLIATQDKKIDDLLALDKEKDGRINKLEGQVEELSKKNNDLSSIINTALDRFFAAHPDEAIRLAKAVKKQS